MASLASLRGMEFSRFQSDLYKRDNSFAFFLALSKFFDSFEPKYCFQSFSSLYDVMHDDVQPIVISLKSSRMNLVKFFTMGLRYGVAPPYGAY